MVDWVGAAEVGISGFFVVLAVVLLARYRQASENVTESSELNHDLWVAMEERLKKQDERILELVGRVEVLQARTASQTLPAQQVTSQNITPSQPQFQQQMQPRQSPEPGAQAVQAAITGELDATEKEALRFLEAGPRPTPEITVRLGRSREHTARLMKSLYDRGLVTRNEAEKPFVYRLTETGRGYLK